MFHEGGWFMGGMHWLWWIVWVAVIAVFAWAIWGRPGGSRGEPNAAPRETPLELLQRRLASGECTTEEYEKRKALLDRDRTAGS